MTGGCIERKGRTSLQADFKDVFVFICFVVLTTDLLLSKATCPALDRTDGSCVERGVPWRMRRAFSVADG
jgi:hypothetical protein